MNESYIREKKIYATSMYVHIYECISVSQLFMISHVLRNSFTFIYDLFIYIYIYMTSSYTYISYTTYSYIYISYMTYSYIYVSHIYMNELRNKNYIQIDVRISRVFLYALFTLFINPFYVFCLLCVSVCACVRACVCMSVCVRERACA